MDTDWVYDSYDPSPLSQSETSGSIASLVGAGVGYIDTGTLPTDFPLHLTQELVPDEADAGSDKSGDDGVDADSNRESAPENEYPDEEGSFLSLTSSASSSDESEQRYVQDAYGVDDDDGLGGGLYE